MKDKFSMKDMVELFNIPKSTLSFWEKKKLIQPKRSTENNYRIYDAKDAVEISDIALYRSMGVSIDSLKNIKEMTYTQLSKIIDETSETIDQQLEQLTQSKQALSMRKEHLEMVQILQENPYVDSFPEFSNLISFDIDNPEFLSLFQKKPYDYTVILSMNPTFQLHEAFVKGPSLIDYPILWQVNSHKKYKTCLIKISLENPLKNNIQEHLDYLEQKNIYPTSIVASYLATFAEDDRYDFYQGWFEYDSPESQY